MKSAIDIGAAAEAYVYFRLRSWGLDVHFANGLGSPFDLFVFVNGEPIRVQVKGTASVEGNRIDYSGSQLYGFSTGRGSNRKRAYDKNDYDILALVAMPFERSVFLTEKVGKRKRVSAKKFSGGFEQRTWERSVERVLNER